MQRGIEVPAGKAAVLEMTAGQLLRVVDPCGKQIGDLVAFAKDDLSERISTAETMNFNNWNARVKVGTILYSNRPRPLFTVTNDTSAGSHDLLFAACTPQFYEYYGGIKGHSNCHDNLVTALAPYDVRTEDLPNPVNLFQLSEVGEGGAINVGEPGAAPGEYIELRAEIDVVVAVSSCPVDLEVLGAGDWVPTALRLEVFDSEEAQ